MVSGLAVVARSRPTSLVKLVSGLPFHTGHCTSCCSPGSLIPELVCKAKQDILDSTVGVSPHGQALT